MRNRILIAIPSGRSQPDIDCVLSLQGVLADLRENGIEYMTRVHHGNCYVALARNVLTYEFKQTDCTHHFFLDDDVAGPPSSLRRLIAHDRDIIVAPYPKKVAPGTPPTKAWGVALTDGGIPDDQGLLECDMVSTGFLLIKRHVIETMYEMYADRMFHDADKGIDICDLFPTGLLDGFPLNSAGQKMWWGEDYAFSVLAKRAGFRIWLDPNIPLIHAGRNVWRGSFVDSCRDKDEVAA